MVQALFTNCKASKLVLNNHVTFDTQLKIYFDQCGNTLLLMFMSCLGYSLGTT